MRRSSGSAAWRSATPFWIATAHSTASTALGELDQRAVPTSLTMRPRYSAISGSMSSLRSAFRRAIVPASSAPTSRL